MCVFGVFGWMRRLALMSLVVISFWFFQLPVQADGSVTLAWDPSTDTNVVSYTVYYGTASGAYANSLSAGPSTTATVTGLLAGTTYFFAATAVNSTGLESPFSNETSYSVPEAPVNHLTISAIASQTVAQD